MHAGEDGALAIGNDYGDGDVNGNERTGNVTAEHKNARVIPATRKPLEPRKFIPVRVSDWV